MAVIAPYAGPFSPRGSEFRTLDDSADQAGIVAVHFFATRRVEYLHDFTLATDESGFAQVLKYCESVDLGISRSATVRKVEQ